MSKESPEVHLPPLQGEGWGGDGFGTAEKRTYFLTHKPHPPPNLPLEGGGINANRIHAIALARAASSQGAFLTGTFWDATVAALLHPVGGMAGRALLGHPGQRRQGGFGVVGLGGLGGGGGKVVRRLVHVQALLTHALRHESGHLLLHAARHRHGRRGRPTLAAFCGRRIHAKSAAGNLRGLGIAGASQGIQDFGQGGQVVAHIGQIVPAHFRRKIHQLARILLHRGHVGLVVHVIHLAHGRLGIDRGTTSGRSQGKDQELTHGVRSIGGFARQYISKHCFSAGDQGNRSQREQPAPILLGNRQIFMGTGGVFMTNKDYWEQIYSTKPADAVSWFQEHAELSLRLIHRTGLGRNGAVIDVGGGASTLVDDLVAEGYADVSVLDLSAAALAVARRRMGALGDKVKWLEGDVTKIPLPARCFDIWHDRAVFHFLTDPADRQAYVQQVMHAVRPGGHVIVATFATDGPEKCSGLPVMRYQAETLHGEFGDAFLLVEHQEEAHHTPFGTDQQFVYCYCRKG